MISKLMIYLRLARLDKPVGIYLLLWPSLMGLMLGALNEGYIDFENYLIVLAGACLLYTSPSPRDRTRSRMPSSA